MVPVNALPGNARVRLLWARTTIRVWPERYRLVSLDPALAGEAGALLSEDPAPFAALVRERDEASLTITTCSARGKAGGGGTRAARARPRLRPA